MSTNCNMLLDFVELIRRLLFNMDSRFYVSLETARLLKEKGYNEKCITYYQDNCKEIYYSFCGEKNSDWEERCVSAPSKAEAIDWLESKGIIVDTSFYFSRGRWSVDIRRNDSWAYVALGEYYSTRLETEEAAIIKALELL